jgi:GH25 family lysozyme M1 (1,4-beta-N-acetylmuramidase)
MLDVEEKTGFKATNAARVKAVIFDTEELFGREPIIYTSASAWNGYVDTYVENKLFVAHYTARSQPIIPWKWEGRGWLVWQFKTKPIDTDRFNGSWEDFLEWIGEDVPLPSNLEARVQKLEGDVQKIVDWIQHYT